MHDGNFEIDCILCSEMETTFTDVEKVSVIVNSWIASQLFSNSLFYDAQSLKIEIKNLPDVIRPNVVELKFIANTSEQFSLDALQLPAKINFYELHSSSSRRFNDDYGEEIALFDGYDLPCHELNNLWNQLYFSTEIKQKLLCFVETICDLSNANLRQDIISFNKTILLVGEPGTGKTSLCKALAQRLAIRVKCNCDCLSILIELHSHALHSKYYAESGKSVQKVFQTIKSLAELDAKCIYIILIDEIESLSSNRETSIQNGEPIDSVRAVNSLLTQLDGLTRIKNVFVFATSNLPNIIDNAVMDRVDWVVEVEKPSISVIYSMLSEAIEELEKGQLLLNPSCFYLLESRNLNIPVLLKDSLHSESLLQSCKSLYEKRLSGRQIKKLPLIVYSHLRAENQKAPQKEHFIEKLKEISSTMKFY